MTEARCRIVVESNGLPGRTEAVLAHERRRIEFASEEVIGVDANVHIDPVDIATEAPPVMASVLLEALGGTTSSRQTASAAFIAGRCSTGDDAVDRDIAAALDAVVRSIDRSERLGPHAHTFVEAVMAQALLGHPDEARQRFVEQLTHPEFRSVADARAAAYLAELGDPTGYPALLRDLHNTGSAQVRMQSFENLLAFVPYDGADVDGVVVDVAAEVRRAITDDAMVADFARRFAAEFGLDGLN